MDFFEIAQARREKEKGYRKERKKERKEEIKPTWERG